MNMEPGQIGHARPIGPIGPVGPIFYRFFLLGDTINLNGLQVASFSMIHDAMTANRGGIHLRHAKAANVWFWDGHAEPVQAAGFTKLGKIVESTKPTFYLWRNEGSRISVPGK